MNNVISPVKFFPEFGAAFHFQQRWSVAPRADRSALDKKAITVRTCWRVKLVLDKKILGERRTLPFLQRLSAAALALRRAGRAFVSMLER